MAANGQSGVLTTPDWTEGELAALETVEETALGTAVS